ncbi:MULTISPECIES: GTPase HflX [Thermoanaerobacterium]|uniref:GTPase HflX n=2 Tax=Thermoanaerobacterium TaxID=28895 RepID=W9EBB2_9THEO|nr:MULTISPECIES: GTPase HflX [Thermoanaerobacterium]AFK86675.1 GTP-binding proten HflX [Thermoanaerobacterium saccharolyticum JW/SL-YS485]ETO38310.1 GTP-binding protein HflX [Thermoanaerobacterium aotearoense SCUT27]
MDNKINDSKEKAVLVGVLIDDDDRESIEELEELANTAGAEVVGVMTQSRTNIDRTSYIGKGKLMELKEFIENNDVDVIIVNDELTGIQIKNIEDVTNVKVIDRTGLILDIFAKRAKSAEGMLQVELAQLKYRLPRLQGIGNDLSRLGGGIGTRGPGETKLETDRRHIKERIRAIEGKIDDLRRHRELLRERRRKNEIPVVAIIGYTNAGKSTLMNVLTNSSVYAEDKLFATLDPTARKLVLPSGREIVLIDTVGFIRKLPHDLVEAFKSTLEELKYADVLLHVIDISAKDVMHKIGVVESVLKDLDVIDKPKINVYNKSDLLDKIPENKGDNVYISAKERIGIDELLETIDRFTYSDLSVLDFYFAYANNDEYLFLKKNSKILKEEYDEKGIKIRAQVSAMEKNVLRDFIIS